MSHALEFEDLDIGHAPALCPRCNGRLEPGRLYACSFCQDKAQHQGAGGASIRTRARPVLRPLLTGVSTRKKGRPSRSGPFQFRDTHHVQSSSG